MNRRHRDILNIILNTDEYITGNELARLCSVTIRTIRNDIKEINDLLSDYGIRVDSGVKKGYFLNKSNKDILKKNNIIRKVIDYEYIIETPNLPIDRQMYILLKLTTYKNMAIEDLAETLYVSTATVNNDIASINKWLKENLKLGISYSLSEGITLNADEEEKRNLISWILARRINVSTVSKYWGYLFEENDASIAVKDIYYIVSTVSKKHNYYLSGHSYQLMCFEIFVAIKRNRLGFNLDEIENINEELTQVITEIKEKLEKALQVKLSKMEWLNLQRYFYSKQFLQGTHISNIENEEASYILDEFFKAVHKKFHINLASNLDNRNKLLLYIAPMLNRLKYGHCISNKIDENIINGYDAEYYMAREIEAIVMKRLNLEVTLIDLAYITIHLVTMCGLWKYTLNTLIVCDYDEAIISFIRDKIRNAFGQKIEVYKVYGYQDFMYENKEKLKNIDFIITTSTIADLTDIPFILIKPEFEQNDIDMIEEHIRGYKK